MWQLLTLMMFKVVEVKINDDKCGKSSYIPKAQTVNCIPPCSNLIFEMIKHILQTNIAIKHF